MEIEEILKEIEEVASVFARKSREDKEDMMSLGLWAGMTVVVGRVRGALSQS